MHRTIELSNAHPGLRASAVPPPLSWPLRATPPTGPRSSGKPTCCASCVDECKDRGVTMHARLRRLRARSKRCGHPECGATDVPMPMHQSVPSSCHKHKREHTHTQANAAHRTPTPHAECQGPRGPTVKRTLQRAPEEAVVCIIASPELHALSAGAARARVAHEPDAQAARLLRGERVRKQCARGKTKCCEGLLEWRPRSASTAPARRTRCCSGRAAAEQRPRLMSPKSGADPEQHAGDRFNRIWAISRHDGWLHLR